MDINNLSGFLFIVMRMFGFILFNPILGRKNVPDLMRSGIAIILAILVYTVNPPVIPAIGSTVEYGVLFLKEFLLGYVVSYIITVFTGIIVFGGEIIDLQLGISMAKIYDPQSNISMPITASLYNALFFMLFFITNAHLNLINIFLISGEIIPYGQFALSEELFISMIGIFEQSMILAMKLAFPILTIEILAEMGVGILMKAIPQINIFSVNIQIKLLIGITALFIFFLPTANFIERLITILFDTIEKSLILIH